MEENRVVGSFHFRLTNAGNLIGEYFNNHGNAILTESSNRIGGSSGFGGNFITSWLEEIDAQRNNLSITQIINTNMFTVVWRDLKGRQTFQGKAILLEENIIYGYYSGQPFIFED